MHAAQEPAGQHQIGQAKQRELLCVGLGQFAVAGLAMSEQALHDMEAMVNLRAHACLCVLQLLLSDPEGSS